MNAARPGSWSWRLIGALVLGSSFVALSLWIAMIGALPGEQSLRIAIIAALTPPDPVILRTANSLGDRIALVGVGLVTVAICRGWFRDGLRVAAILVLAAAAGGAVTWMIGRPRPEGMGLSYPSGHVFGSIVVYGTLAMVVFKVVTRPAVRGVIVVGAIAIIVSVCAARIVLRAHWPSDVAAALLAGGTYLLLATHVVGGKPPRRSPDDLSHGAVPPHRAWGGTASNLGGANGALGPSSRRQHRGPHRLASIAVGLALALSPGPAAGQQERATAARVSSVDVLPGMPAVLNPRDLYSETGAGHLSPAAARALPRVYVSNLKSNDVYVIHPATFTVVDRFRVGINPPHVVPSYDLRTLLPRPHGQHAVRVSEQGRVACASRRP